ncbi:hypothetical protein BDQ17DRAFT_1470738 [Cyathus striatus]|nr:hypothetical protein BDQ17DRAFT_1470738 [Cyathus striatus]
MFAVLKLAALLASIVAFAEAHGVVTTPTPRALGSAALAACGTGVYNTLKSDLYGPIENSAKKEDSGYNANACHLFFCRGYQARPLSGKHPHANRFSDNTKNVKTYPASTSVHFLVDIEAHHTGTANVSVVNLATQTLIDKPLFYWPVYSNDSLGPADWVKNETDFSVTIPDLGTQCKTAGSCAIQWWWYAFNGQTYESCVDFTQ